jgi:hypothetical protein
MAEISRIVHRTDSAHVFSMCASGVRFPYVCSRCGVPTGVAVVFLVLLDLVGVASSVIQFAGRKPRFLFTLSHERELCISFGCPF